MYRLFDKTKNKEKDAGVSPFLKTDKRNNITIAKILIIYFGTLIQRNVALFFILNLSNFQLNLKFGRPKITTNEKIVLASMFYPLYALAVQLSPELKSSGIQELVRTNSI